MLDPKNLKPGQEQHEIFTSRIGRKTAKRIQYDYRNSEGELFSCVGKTLEGCQQLRKQWQVGKLA
ncbi:MAG: hypothetical protein H6Q68_1023 [Firmicutes bacterium]|nr:hypothetical protein [Bacillota bacterium]